MSDDTAVLSQEATAKAREIMGSYFSLKRPDLHLDIARAIDAATREAYRMAIISLDGGADSARKWLYEEWRRRGGKPNTEASRG